MFWKPLIAILLSLCFGLSTEAMENEKRSDHGLSRRAAAGKIGAMCSWEALSSEIVRDQVFFNGGKLKLANLTIDGKPLNLFTDDRPAFSYYLNLGTPFNTTDPPFKTIDTPFPQVTNGFMAANDNSFWLYGGYLTDTASIALYPQANSIQVYDAYLQGPQRIWTQGWQTGAALSNDVTRYVAAGAGVNVRDLNTTYYFSGLRNEDWGEIRGPELVAAQYIANVTSQQFITADLSDQVRTSWTNTTLQSNVRPRVNPEMVYVPTGKFGTLMVIGGALNTDWMRPFLSKMATTNSLTTGPSFLETIEVYDIGSKKWYLQNTTGEIPPTGLVQHCAVVASAKDGSSHQVYIYGGYPGQGDAPITYSDDVYVLSVPAFEWIKVYTGLENLGRRAHRCVKPLPDQMFILGGVSNDAQGCIDIVRVFNLNDLSFKDRYDPAIYEDYKVPRVVQDVIGGDQYGGATKTASEWADPTLEAIFVTEKPPTRAVTWYPYTSVAATTSGLAPTISVVETKTATPKYVWPVVAVCIVVVLLIAAGGVFFLCLRKKRQRAAKKAEGNQQFQTSPEKGGKTDEYYPQYPQYPSAQTSPYNTVTSMSTLGPGSVYSHQRQYSQDTTFTGDIHELSSDRNPVELDAGQETFKLSVVQENAEAVSILVPTPATEISDPISSRQPSHRTTGRVSVFSEMTTTSDDGEGVSPISPDNLEIKPDDPASGNLTTPVEGSWWRKRGSKGPGARRFSSFSSTKSNQPSS